MEADIAVDPVKHFFHLLLRQVRQTTSTPAGYAAAASTVNHLSENHQSSLFNQQN